MEKHTKKTIHTSGWEVESNDIMSGGFIKHVGKWTFKAWNTGIRFPGILMDNLRNVYSSFKAIRGWIWEMFILHIK